ncbi:MAG: tRNA 2-thiouridine(34) synthase MnmA [Clostridiales bacterium]|nr:tRNA 2-thiouridine(34) synthase MnmA [Clostridiales bacterium]
MSMDRNKVLLGLSGGVDSTAAVFLLKEKGLEVTGFYFDVLGDQDEEEARARKAAEDTGIPFLSVKAADLFEKEVLTPFCETYRNGQTPNPCILCNPAVKFSLMIQAANETGAYWIATGHYARIKEDPAAGIYYVHKGLSEKRDQSYMLYRLPQAVLSRLLLPLGDTAEKDDLRDMLRKEGLFNADDRDSQDICFIKDGDLERFLNERDAGGFPGNFVDKSGKILGQHKGLSHYTIGQRKGLGNLGLGKPAFVLALDPEKNEVVLGDDPDLFSQTVRADRVFFSGFESNTDGMPEQYEGMQVTAKIRYAAAPAPARLHQESPGIIRLDFETPQRAATPGQSVVIYQGDQVLGGGFIC